MRRKLRNIAKPKTIFWIETDSESSQYIIPKFKPQNFGKKVRVIYPDGTKEITDAVAVDFSEVGIKRIEYFFIDDYFFGGFTDLLLQIQNSTVQNEIENYLGSLYDTNKFIDKGDSYIYRYNYEIETKITDLKIENYYQNFWFENQSILDFTIPNSTEKFYLYDNNNLADITANGQTLIYIKNSSANVIGNNVTQLHIVNANVSTNLLQNNSALNRIYLQNSDVDINNDIVDLTNSPNINYMYMSGVNGVNDIIFNPTKFIDYIYFAGNDFLIGKDFVIPSGVRMLINKSPIKNITINNPENTTYIDVNLRNINTQNYVFSNEVGTQITNITSCINLTTLYLVYNERTQKLISDYSVFYQLKELIIGGNLGGGVPNNITFPSSLEQLTLHKINSFDISNLSNLKRIYFERIDNLPADNLIPSFNGVNDFRISGNNTANQIELLIDRLIANPINVGQFGVISNELTSLADSNHTTPYNDLSQEIKNLITKIQTLIDKGWTLQNDITSLIIRQNVNT